MKTIRTSASRMPKGPGVPLTDGTEGKADVVGDTLGQPLT